MRIWVPSCRGVGWVMRALPTYVPLVVAMVCGAAGGSWLEGAEPLAKSKYNSGERMTRARLEAADASIQALAAKRRVLPEVEGLKDFRCSFHAHAEDASHTAGTRPEMLADARSIICYRLQVTN